MNMYVCPVSSVRYSVGLLIHWPRVRSPDRVNFYFDPCLVQALQKVQKNYSLQNALTKCSSWFYSVVVSISGRDPLGSNPGRANLLLELV